MSNTEQNAAREGAGTLKPGLLLALMAFLGVGLLAGVHELTRDRIAAQEAAALRARLGEVLDPGLHDNDLSKSVLTLTAPGHLGHEEPVRVFLARRSGAPTAVVVETIAPDGYNGTIELLVGVDLAGVVTGVRVVNHRETPGLGDPIEARRSDWIEGFRGRTLGDPPATRWTVRKDGGEFDQFTGATITPRAVTRAIARTLALVDAEGASWFDDEREGTPAATRNERPGSELSP
ncbi:MAG: electron transport complex subunit RsxG [Xanthomonadales bacterium]|jgi:electron transport complex protein RnfG|nr:electron transport complex subunit RsxG [Xanthomonadales bacterium]